MAQNPTRQTEKAEPHMESAIATCRECRDVCIETMQYCLRQGGEHVKADHIQHMQDCIDACGTCADFMVRGSEMHNQTCGVCAEACRRCAQSCAQFENDEKMQHCADVCRRCADSCGKMAAA